MNISLSLWQQSFRLSSYLPFFETSTELKDDPHIDSCQVISMQIITKDKIVCLFLFNEPENIASQQYSDKYGCLYLPCEW